MKSQESKKTPSDDKMENDNDDIDSDDDDNVCGDKNKYQQAKY